MFDEKSNLLFRVLPDCDFGPWTCLDCSIDGSSQNGSFFFWPLAGVFFTAGSFCRLTFFSIKFSISVSFCNNGLTNAYVTFFYHHVTSVPLFLGLNSARTMYIQLKFTKMNLCGQQVGPKPYLGFSILGWLNFFGWLVTGGSICLFFLSFSFIAI